MRLSFIKRTANTSPSLAKSSRTWASLALYGKFPTYKVFVESFGSSSVTVLLPQNLKTKAEETTPSTKVIAGDSATREKTIAPIIARDAISKVDLLEFILEYYISK
ncbi:hypothetical protein VAE151_570063 [Vibrio aestuarianus]|nr:hypothetical protein VAE308_1070062 [Vibrio aestuarianus]CAH8213702.1 hypothetical protein VIBAE_A40062 [Vibrio aestuarianus subsp. francensis]CAH8214778.1 hypothetical protein VAE055_390062 [Vibrio aestuarianus]CAH8215048.1 hypothetical protein VAE128_470061 [Vibrio aestuarianus]CAH8215214.1 hypothetical protein VAE130_580061 [Vibrio aestuarianus]